MLCFLVKAESSRWVALSFTVGNFFPFFATVVVVRHLQRSDAVRGAGPLDQFPPVSYSLGMDGIGFPLVLMTTPSSCRLRHRLLDCDREARAALHVHAPGLETAMVGVFVALDFVCSTCSGKSC